MKGKDVGRGLRTDRPTDRFTFTREIDHMAQGGGPKKSPREGEEDGTGAAEDAEDVSGCFSFPLFLLSWTGLTRSIAVEGGRPDLACLPHCAYLLPPRRGTGTSR